MTQVTKRLSTDLPLLPSTAWLRGPWPSWRSRSQDLLHWNPIPRNASWRPRPSERTNFDLPRTCIVNYLCWKISFLGLYGRDPPTFAHFIYTLIPRQTEASARAWIDAFFFRVSAMLPPNQRMALNVEHAVPATTISPSNLSTLSGFVDYTAVAASQRAAGKSTSTHLTPPPQLTFRQALNFMSWSRKCRLASSL